MDKLERAKLECKIALKISYIRKLTDEELLNLNKRLSEVIGLETESIDIEG